MRALALLLLLASPAAARCPTADDLAGGIGVAYDDGSRMVFRAASQPGRLASEGVMADGGTFRGEVAWGLYPLRLTGRLGGENAGTTIRMTTDYGQPVDGLPRPAPGLSFAVATTTTDTYGERRDTVSHAFGPLGRLVVAGCAYDAMESLIAYSGESGFSEGGHFIPALGLGVIDWQETADEPRKTLRVTAIWAVE